MIKKNFIEKKWKIRNVYLHLSWIYDTELLILSNIKAFFFKNEIDFLYYRYVYEWNITI